MLTASINVGRRVKPGNAKRAVMSPSSTRYAERAYIIGHQASSVDICLYHLI